MDNTNMTNISLSEIMNEPGLTTAYGIDKNDFFNKPKDEPVVVQEIVMRGADVIFPFSHHSNMMTGDDPMVLANDYYSHYTAVAKRTLATLNDSLIGAEQESHLDVFLEQQGQYATFLTLADKVSDAFSIKWLKQSYQINDFHSLSNVILAKDNLFEFRAIYLQPINITSKQYGLDENGHITVTFLASGLNFTLSVDHIVHEDGILPVHLHHAKVFIDMDTAEGFVNKLLNNAQVVRSETSLTSDNLPKKGQN